MAICRLTTKDLLRQPICLLVTLSAVILIVFLPQVFAYQLGQQENLARDSALATQLLFGIILTGYAAASTLHTESTAGTLLTLFSRPVSRATLFLGKLCGVATVMLIFVWASSSAALVSSCLTPRHFESHTSGLIAASLVFPFVLGISAFLNYKHERSFPAACQILLPIGMSLAALFVGSRSADGELVGFASELDWRLLAAGFMGAMVLLLLSCLALGLAARLRPAPATALLAVVFTAGLLSDYLETLCLPWPVMRLAVHSFLPDIQSFWLADRLSDPGIFNPGVIWRSIFYVIAYSTGVSCVGILLFRRREF